MSSDQIDLAKVTADGVARVLRYLPTFLEPDRSFGDDVSAKVIGPKTIEIDRGDLGDVEQSFVEACYEANLVQPFDWMRWTEEKPGIAGSTEFIRTASMENIIMLLTTHLRADRFAYGHLVTAFREGLIAEILIRLSVIHFSSTGERTSLTWQTAPNDPQVINEHLRFENNECCVTIRVQQISWSAPYEPVSTWVVAAVIPAYCSSRERDFAVQRVLNSAEYPQICSDCGARKPVGLIITDPYQGGHDVCHDCAQQGGTVFYLGRGLLQL